MINSPLDEVDAFGLRHRQRDAAISQRMADDVKRIFVTGKIDRAAVAGPGNDLRFRRQEIHGVAGRVPREQVAVQSLEFEIAPHVVRRGADAAEDERERVRGGLIFDGGAAFGVETFPRPVFRKETLKSPASSSPESAQSLSGAIWLAAPKV